MPSRPALLPSLHSSPLPSPRSSPSSLAAPSPVVARPELTEARLARALRDLGSHVRRGLGPALETPRCATGLPEVDALLGGGVPRGRVSEVTGPPSSGRTSFALALLAEATRRGELAVVVDADDAFDPVSAEAAGVALPRVLWVRARRTSEALRSAERALEARGFPLVLLDLGQAPDARALAGAATWPRLARAAAGAEAALVVVAGRRCAGPWCELALDLEAERACFEGEGGAPALLTGLDVRVVLARSRSAAPAGAERPGAARAGHAVSLRLRSA